MKRLQPSPILWKCAGASHDRNPADPQARRRLRRVRLCRPSCRARAGQARLPHPRRLSAGPISPAICSRSAMSARSSRCRPMCACAGRSTAPCRAPTMSSIWSPSCMRAAGRNSPPSTNSAPARSPRPRAPSAPASPISRRSAPICKSQSDYARTKALGEKAVLETIKDAVIFRPSIIFGPEDGFFNRFANMARYSPVLPLIGGGQTQVPAGLCRRCRRSGGALGRRQGQWRPDLRAWRAEGADLQGMHGRIARR